MIKKNILEYVIVIYFNEENEAYIYEEKLTAHYKELGQCKFNISIGRRTSQETKIKFSSVLKGKKRSKETKEKIKKNHNRPLAKTLFMYKEDKLIKIFQSSREAGAYAAENGISSYSWCCWISLKTGEITKPTKDFPIGGYRFVYQDDKIKLKKDQ